jgi:hypothetical protein
LAINASCALLPAPRAKKRIIITKEAEEAVQQ